MKRLFSVVVLAGGLMFMGITNASAAMWCADDPTLNLGTPYNLNVTLSTGVSYTNVYASGTSSTTTFGFIQGVGK